MGWVRSVGLITLSFFFVACSNSGNTSSEENSKIQSTENSEVGNVSTGSSGVIRAALSTAPVVSTTSSTEPAAAPMGTSQSAGDSGDNNAKWWVLGGFGAVAGGLILASQLSDDEKEKADEDAPKKAVGRPEPLPEFEPLPEMPEDAAAPDPEHQGLGINDIQDDNPPCDTPSQFSQDLDKLGLNRDPNAPMNPDGSYPLDPRIPTSSYGAGWACANGKCSLISKTQAVAAPSQETPPPAPTVSP